MKDEKEGNIVVVISLFSIVVVGKRARKGWRLYLKRGGEAASVFCFYTERGREMCDGVSYGFLMTCI